MGVPGDKTVIPVAGNTARGIFHIVGMECGDCASVIAKALRERDGILSVNINYITDKAYVEYDPAKVSPQDIMALIKRVGRKAIEDQQRRIS